MALQTKQRLRIIHQAENRCQECGRLGTEENGCWIDLEVHHLLHRAHGGEDNVGNLIVLCYECHDKTHDRKIRSGPTKRHRSLSTDRVSLKLYLPAPMEAALRREKERTGLGVSELIRRAIDHYLGCSTVIRGSGSPTTEERHEACL